jgi:hypothetical protein
MPLTVCLADTPGADYQFNAAAIGFEKNNLNDTGNTLSPMAGVQYFLSPVKNDPQQSFDQHEFIQRSSNLYIGTVPSRVETSSYKTMVNTGIVSGSYYVDDWMLGLGYGKGSGQLTLNASSSYYWDVDSNTYFYRLGYYLLPSSLMTLGVDDSNITETARYTGGKDVAQKITTTSLNSRTLWNWGGQNTLALELTGKHIKLDESSSKVNREATLSLKYYPRPDMYAQWSITSNQGDETSSIGNTSVVSASYAISPRISVVACYLDFTRTGSGTGLGLHSMLFGGNVRF